MNAAPLLWGIVFGSIGFGFFLYGKKQKKVAPLVCGLALMVFPYFVASTTALVVIGASLVIAPFFVRL